MKTSPDFTKQEEITIWVVCGVCLAIYAFILFLALRNLIYICKLRITKLLILLLYFFSICEDITSPILLVLFTYNPDSITDTHNVINYIAKIALTFELGFVFTITLTNYNLATSI